MEQELLKLKNEILGKLDTIKNSEVLRDLEIQYLGRKGKLTEILRGIADLNAEEKKTFGKLSNEVKLEIQAKINIKKEEIDNQGLQGKIIDVTLPGEKIKGGHLHPITILQNELEDLFVSMGFMILDGPELESEYYCFEALNIPAHHPARDMQDTFYIKTGNETEDKKASDLVMRTHTSSVQVRAMQKYGAPLRCVSLGRVFRHEATDDCHDSTFYQLEGLMLGESISIANLTAIIKEMLSKIFKQNIEIRVRPGYFPFVEPGMEFDMRCTICLGKGCPSCKHSGWLEMIGAGMVHPNVLRAGGIDPEKFSGFAFGIGMTRLAMMLYGIEDIRLFQGGDLRFLGQF